MAEIEELARRFAEAWNAGNEHIVDELADTDLLVSYSHFPTPLRGREAFKEALRQTHRFFPDLRLFVDEIIVRGTDAVVRWHYRGSHQQGELFGVAAAGTSVDVQGITIYRFSSGRVQEEFGVVDNLSLLTQLQGAGTAA